MGIIDILIIVIVVIAVIVTVFFFLNRWASRKTVENNELIERTRQSAEIFVIDKQMGKLLEANIPKAALEQVPKLYKFIKTPLVKAKIGPQVITLMCDKRVFKALPVKKTVKVELAGMYIVDMKGLKSVSEQKAHEKAKKQKAKQPGGKGKK